MLKQCQLSKQGTLELILFDEATLCLKYFFRASPFKGPLLFSKHLYKFLEELLFQMMLLFKIANFQLLPCFYSYTLYLSFGN